jgi:hypothetical protein
VDISTESDPEIEWVTDDDDVRVDDWFSGVPPEKLKSRFGLAISRLPIS